MGDMATATVDEAFEIDSHRYQVDADYRRRVHADLEFDEGEDPLDWAALFSTDDELQAAPIFSSGDYPTEEAAMAALDDLLDDILEGVLREAAKAEAETEEQAFYAAQEVAFADLRAYHASRPRRKR